MQHTHQRGITLIGFLLVLIVVGVAAFVVIKLLPMYQEYYSVRTALRSMANEPGIVDMEPSAIKEKFFRRLAIDYTESVKPANLDVQRTGSGWLMKVDYEVRRSLVGNLDVVGRFDASQELTRRAGAE